jgi:hypothetical protein
MPDVTRILEHIGRLRDELNQLEQLVKGGDGPAPDLIEPVTEGEISFDNAGDLEIVGGVATSKFPDCCAIGSAAGYYCTGTLIAPSLVITAKHCKDISRVFFGRNVSQPQGGETIDVALDIPHPDPLVDIRVLVLQRPASATPRHVAQGAELGSPRTAIVAGFGTTDLAGTSGYGVKRYARVPIMSLSSTSAADQQKYGSRPDVEMVAGHLGLRRDSCKGDSGGPLYISDPNGNGYFLLGATSRGTSNAQHVCGDGGIYVRVDKFLDWIRAATGIDVDGPLS